MKKIDLEVDDIMNYNENIFHLSMTFIIGSIMRKSSSERIFMNNCTYAFNLNKNTLLIEL